MFISWLGQSCFKIQEKDITIIIDPYGNKSGLKMSKTNADIVLVSHDHDDHNNIDAIKGDAFVIDSPGEYEVKDIFVQGIPSYHDNNQGADQGSNTIFLIEISGMTVVHLGDLGQHELTDAQLEVIEGADILMIPVGNNKFTIGAKEAIKIISEIEPRMVIPMHYKIPGLKYPVESVDAFIKEVGKITKPDAAKLKISKKDLPESEREIIILPKS